MDIKAAAEADLSLTLSRGGAPYAECFLEFDGKERPYESSVAMAVFKVSLRSQMWRGYPIVQAHMGACDLALKIKGIQPGLPKVQAGDAATVVVVTPDATIPFLDGRFRRQNPPQNATNWDSL